jgi:hypothetical protein
MGIKSEPFQSVILSGKEDIQKFKRQIQRTAPTKEAIATVGTGVKLVAEFERKGYASLRVKRSTKAG